MAAQEKQSFALIWNIILMIAIASFFQPFETGLTIGFLTVIAIRLRKVIFMILRFLAYIAEWFTDLFKP